jgi:excisionase family DNA binding protein
LRVSEAAEAPGISRSMGYELARRGEWPIVQVGRSKRVPYEGLRQWVNANTTPAIESGSPKATWRSGEDEAIR